MFKFGVAICLLGLLVQNFEFKSLDWSLVVCPNEAREGDVVADQQVTALNVRIPETGSFPYPISCFRALDNSQANTVVNITKGGIGSKFVEVRFLTMMSSSVNYRVMVYINSEYETSNAGELPLPNK